MPFSVSEKLNLISGVPPAECSEIHEILYLQEAGFQFRLSGFLYFFSVILTGVFISTKPVVSIFTACRYFTLSRF